MSRNDMAIFGSTPGISTPRSRIPLNHNVKFSGDVGQLIPVDFWEVLPGDTFSVATNKVVRFQTLLTPLMDNMYLDTFWFFVPNRILWDHWKQFMGEKDHAWYSAITYTIPKLVIDDSHPNFKGSIADYLGVSPTATHCKVSALPFRAYGMIVDEWFRDENWQNPLPIYTGDSDVYIAAENETTTIRYVQGGVPYVANKLHDVFTSVTPSPQKGQNVLIPGGYVNLQAPVFGSADFAMNHLTPIADSPVSFNSVNAGSNRVLLNNAGSGNVTGSSSEGDNNLHVRNLGIDTTSIWSDPDGSGTRFKNEVVNGTIVQLRQAFQVQKLLERDMLGGTRYRELLKAHFGVTSPDASMQVPQYLGGNRIPIMVNQIANTAETSTQKLGNVGALSVTTDSHDDFVFSASEHGLIMCLACVRYNHSYSQGLHRYWSKESRFDFYWPEFNSLSAQPVYLREIDARYGNYTWTDSNNVVHEGNRVWGYSEYGYDYRYIPDRTSGEMRPGVPNGLASWTLSDYYSTEPRMDGFWLHEDKANVDRVLAVTSSTADQYWSDFYFKVTATRPMSLYSIPGWADHY